MRITPIVALVRARSFRFAECARPVRVCVPVMLVALALSLAMGGCAPTTPGGPPDVRGAIMTASINQQGDSSGSIMVVGSADSGSSYDRASVRITPDTRILRTTDGRVVRARLQELTVGLEVDVWFVGPVAESYPVQATAGTVLIR